MAPSVPVFDARGLTKIYRMGDVEVHALRGADLDLFQSEFVVILGPSGIGQSPLLNILGGLDVPTSGTVRYRNHDLTAADERGPRVVPPRRRSAVEAQVLSGLLEGDRVIVHPGDTVADGVRVALR